MRSGLLVFVAAVALAFGTPIVNVGLLWLVGTTTVVYNPGRPDTYTAISGPNAPRPGWVPQPPRSLVMTAHQVISGRPDGYGSLDLVTTLSLERTRAFYTQTLADLGFEVSDEGNGTLTPGAAAFLGIAGTLIAERPVDSSEDYKWVSVQIRTSEGWFVRTRYVSVHWRRTRPEILAQQQGPPR